jgi:hypothetical protein
MYSSSTVYRFVNEMMIDTAEPQDYEKDKLYKNYVEWCDALKIDAKSRCTSLLDFSAELSHTGLAKNVRLRDDDDSRPYATRMFKTYDHSKLAGLVAKMELNETKKANIKDSQKQAQTKRSDLRKLNSSKVRDITNGEIDYDW